MSTYKITWHEWEIAPEGGSVLGHGIHFHDSHQSRQKDLIAFIEGFQWLHGGTAEVNAYHIAPNKVTTAKVLTAMKRKIEAMVRSGKIGDGEISKRIYSCVNG